MTTPIANIDNATLNLLSPNLDIGDVADPALRLAYFQYLNVYIQTITTAFNAFVANGGIATANLADLSVTAAKLADLAVATSKIADLAVVTAKINDLAVTAAKIAVGTITSTQIADLGIATGDLADALITTIKIADANVTTAKLIDSCVTLAKMADASVGTAELVDGAVTAVKIAIGAVGSSQLNPNLLTNFGDIAVQAEFDRRGVNVMKYGAVGDGVTNDTAAILSAIAALTAGSTLFFPPGSYLCSSTLAFTLSNLKIVGFGAKIISTVASLASAMSFSGSLSTSYAISAAIAAGDTTFTVSAANSALLAAGDYIKITSDELYHTMSGRTYYKGEMVKVVSVNTTTGVVTIEPNGFILAYSVTTFLPVARKVSSIENITIEGIEISGSGTDNGQVGFQVNTVKNISIHNCKIHDVDAGIIIKDCLFADIYDNRIYNCTKSGTGYGISVEGVSQFVNVFDNNMATNRHSFTTGGGDGVCMYINVHHNKIVFNTNAGLNTHGNARFVTFDNNQISNGLLGISTYCPHTTMQNNTLVNINQAALYAIEAGGINYTALNNIIERCSITSFDAVQITVTSSVVETNDFVIIKGNTINNNANGGAITVSAGDAKIVDVSSNNMNNTGYSFITISAGINVKANDNTCNSSSRAGTNSTYGINIANTSSIVSVAIVNNNNIYNVYNGIKMATPNLGLADGNTVYSCTVLYNMAATDFRDGENMPHIYAGTLTWDPASLADGTGETSSALTITGAAFGDKVEVAAAYDIQGITLTGYVSAANTVKARLQNETGGTIDLASGLYRFRVRKK